MIINDLDGCYIVFDTKKQEHGTGHPTKLLYVASKLSHIRFSGNLFKTPSNPQTFGKSFIDGKLKPCFSGFLSADAMLAPAPNITTCEPPDKCTSLIFIIL